MYFFFSLLLTFVFLILTVAGETQRGRAHPRALFYINLVFTISGALLLVVTWILAHNAIEGGGFEAEFASWAWDMLAVYYRLSLLTAAVFCGIAAVSCFVAVFDRKQRTGFPLKIRLSAIVVFSVVLLFAAPLYSFVTVNDKVALDLYVLLTGFGEALLLRAPLLIEYGYRLRIKPGDS